MESACVAQCADLPAFRFGGFRLASQDIRAWIANDTLNIAAHVEVRSAHHFSSLPMPPHYPTLDQIGILNFSPIDTSQCDALDAKHELDLRILGQTQPSGHLQAETAQVGD